jgi:ankyrin repeat protein
LHDSEKNKQKPKSDEKIKKKKLNDETSEVAVKKKKLSTSPTLLAKKKINDGDDTDHLETSSDNDEEEKITSKKKSSKKSPTKIEGIKTKKPMAAPLAPPSSSAVNTSTNANALISQNKKRRLVKVMSNRLLEENANVKVYVKDPFFEDMSPEIKLPFISAYVQSKLAFKAIYLNDTKMLKHLIDDRERVASVHIGKAVYNKWIPAEYAVYMENQKALELLIDDFVSKLNQENKHGAKRTQMPDSMFERFTSTGNYNPRSLGGVPFVRKLTESRGVKEGNNAFTKDQETLALIQNGSSRCVHTFFKRLFDLAFEYGSSIEMFDFLMSKWKSLDMNQKASFDIYSYTFRYIYENIISIIVFGHRKLAAHVLENAPAGTGFNAVHIEVLNVDNDAELKCLLRANMCTKKPFANDLVTPIHCASINPNVKYLKTLLSITQDFNIADKKGRKPVHFAAVCEGPSPLEYLISRVSPYELDHAGNTPLHYACLANRSMNVEILLNFAQKKQEDDAALTSEMLIDNKYGLGGLNKPNKRGQLPIHLAISRNSYKCVSILLKYGCNVEYPLPNSMGKITPLMYACQLGHFKIVKLLIENNAKVEARDRFQRTAIIHAAMCGHVRPLSHLLNMGANPNVVDSSGNSCLHYACAYGWYYAMRAILDAGGHVNVANDWKLTPFGVAFLKGHVGICDQLLLMHKNQIDINFRTEDGETLVMLSVSSTNCLNEASIEQLNYIVNKLGGNSQLVDAKGNNAFHYLAANKIDKSYFSAAVAASVGSEADKAVDELEKEQERFRYKMADLLLRSGCDPNAQNNELETSLYTAIACGNYKFARYLLTKKDTNSKITSQQNPNGQTILSLMADKCFEMDVGFIIFGDGDENLSIKYAKEFETMAKIKDENGQTPFQIACIKLNEYLAKNTNSSHVLPVSLVRFIKFLYKDCKSNPNEVIQSKKVKQDVNNSPSTFHPIKAARVQMPMARENDDGGGDENDAGLEEATKQEICTPIFKLIDDKCVDLIEDLFSISNDSSLNLVKIDFNYYDSHGMTPLLKSIALKQTKFALKLIEIFSKNYSNTNELANQICKNSLVHLNENIIQLCIRHDQFIVFNKIIDLMCSSEANSANLFNMLKHKNVYFQNILHVFASLDKNLKGHFLNGNFLNEFAQKISTHFSKAVSFTHRKNVLLQLALSSDKIGRNPLHLCLLYSDQNRVHVDLEIFFAEQMFNYCVDETDDRRFFLFFELIRFIQISSQTRFKS